MNVGGSPQRVCASKNGVSAPRDRAQVRAHGEVGVVHAPSHPRGNEARTTRAGALTVEFMPRDGGHLPEPSAGDRIALTGVGVFDIQHGGTSCTRSGRSASMAARRVRVVLSSAAALPVTARAMRTATAAHQRALRAAATVPHPRGRLGAARRRAIGRHLEPRPPRTAIRATRARALIPTPRTTTAPGAAATARNTSRARSRSWARTTTS